MTNIKLKPVIGAVVQFCCHDGVFIADIFIVEDVVAVVRANGPVTPDNIDRKGRMGPATHQLLDFPKAGVWQANRGIFVVPVGQVRVLA